MTGPSEKAIQAAEKVWSHRVAAQAVRAAHDPSLGLDRSVCLRDVVEALRERGAFLSHESPADFIEQEFGS